MPLFPNTPSVNDLYNTGKVELVARRPELTILPGDLSDVILSANAAVGDHVVAYVDQRMSETFIDSASGDKLTKLVDDHIGIQRLLANAAVVPLYFYRLVSGTAGTIAAGFQVATLPDFNGVSYTYTTDSDLTFGVSQLDGYVNATCTTTGPGGNVALFLPNGEHSIVKQISPSFDSSISVYNLEAAAGGADEETDENLRNRARNFWITLRRATLASLEYGAEQVNGIFTANAVEELDPSGALDYQGNPLKTGVVNVYVADQDGNANTIMVNSAIMELELYRAAGGTVNVYGAELVNLQTKLGAQLEVVLSLRATSGQTSINIQNNVKAAVVARINRLNPGEYMIADYIKQQALNTDVDNIISVILQYTIGVTTTNFSDALFSDLLPNQVIRATLNDIKVSQA